MKWFNINSGQSDKEIRKSLNSNSNENVCLTILSNIEISKVEYILSFGERFENFSLKLSLRETSSVIPALEKLFRFEALREVSVMYPANCENSFFDVIASAGKLTSLSIYPGPGQEHDTALFRALDKLEALRLDNVRIDFGGANLSWPRLGKLAVSRISFVDLESVWCVPNLRHVEFANLESVSFLGINVSNVTKIGLSNVKNVTRLDSLNGSRVQTVELFNVGRFERSSVPDTIRLLELG